MAKAKKTAVYTILSALAVPDDVVKLKDGQDLAPGDTPRLPVEYGDHLVSLRAAREGASAGDDDAEAKAAEEKKAAEAKAAEEKAIAEAQAELDAAKARLDAADGDEAKAAAKTEVDNAQAKLEALTK